MEELPRQLAVRIEEAQFASDQEEGAGNDNAVDGQRAAC